MDVGHSGMCYVGDSSGRREVWSVLKCVRGRVRSSEVGTGRRVRLCCSMLDARRAGGFGGAIAKAGESLADER